MFQRNVASDSQHEVGASVGQSNSLKQQNRTQQVRPLIQGRPAAATTGKRPQLRNIRLGTTSGTSFNSCTSSSPAPRRRQRRYFLNPIGQAIALSKISCSWDGGIGADGGLEIDKETKLRMEASRITVMTWLQSLPSPKAVQLDHHSLKGLPDDISLGNGVLEMCDEEEVDIGHRHSQEIDVYAHMASFGKFLQSSPLIAYAPQQTRMVDIEIAAQ